MQDGELVQGAYAPRSGRALNPQGDRTMKRLICMLLVMGLAGGAAAQEKPAEPKAPAVKPAPDKEALYKQFEKSMNGVKLVGRFTRFGKEDEKPAKEEYTISSVTKM